MKEELKTVAIWVGAAAIVALGLYVAHLQGQLKQINIESAKRVSSAAHDLGATPSVSVTTQNLIEHLTNENAQLVERLRAVDSRVFPSTHARVEAKVADVIPLIPFGDGRIGVAGGRFVVAPDLSALTRNQRFRLDAVIITNVDDSRLGKMTFEEIDPETGVPLLVTPTIESRFEFVKERRELGVFHPRLVAGVENHGYPLLGVEVLNGERFGGLLAHTNLSLFGVYDIKKKTALGGASVMYRLFNSNVSLGPAVFGGGSGVSYGAAATIEITR